MLAIFDTETLPARLSSGYSGVLPQFKGMLVRETGEAKMALGVAALVCLPLCVCPVKDWRPVQCLSPSVTLFKYDGCKCSVGREVRFHHHFGWFRWCHLDIMT